MYVVDYPSGVKLHKNNVKVQLAKAKITSNY